MARDNYHEEQGRSLMRIREALPHLSAWLRQGDMRTLQELDTIRAAITDMRRRFRASKRRRAP